MTKLAGPLAKPLSFKKIIADGLTAQYDTICYIYIYIVMILDMMMQLSGRASNSFKVSWSIGLRS